MEAHEVHDSFFGGLRWNKELEWFEGTVAWDEQRTVEIFLPTDGRGPSQIISNGRRVLAAVREREDEFPQHAAFKLLPIHNRYWNRVEEIDIDSFASRMTLSEIEIRPDGSVELGYEDGDLFAGHQIVIELTPKLSFKDAWFQG